jgi:hypothetical protein
MSPLWNLIVACTGPSASEPPVVEAKLAPGPVWQTPGGVGSVALLPGDDPRLVVGRWNTTNASEAGGVLGEMAPMAVVHFLAAPFDGGTISAGSAAATLSHADHGWPISAGDWTGDGVEDLFVGHRLYAGPFGPETTQEAALSDATPLYGLMVQVAPCDLDSDGILDLCTNHGAEVGPIQATLTDADLDVTYEKPLIAQTKPAAYGSWFEDLDGDGDVEWLVGTEHELLLVDDPLAQASWDLPAQADVVWTEMWGTAATGTLAIVDDVDGDGRRDILAGPRILTDPTGGRLEDGAVRFADFGSRVVTGDFDGDGHDDVATTAGLRGEVALFLGPFELRTYGPEDAAAVWKGVEDGQDGFGEGLFAEDVDGDGRDDLIVLAPSWSDADGDRVGRMHLLRGGGL